MNLAFHEISIHPPLPHPPPTKKKKKKFNMLE